MPQLGPLDPTIMDAASALVVGATVQLYREGATCNGDQVGVAPLTVTVRHPGKIIAGDTVFIENDNSTTYSVGTVTATTMQLSGFVGALSVLNGQRIVPSNNQPTIYSDDQGGASVSQPLTSDLFGSIATTGGLTPLWMEGGAYHVLAAKPLEAARLYQVLVVAGEAPGVVYSGERDGATAVAHIEDTRFALATAGAKLKSGRNLGVEKYFFDKDGLISIVTGGVVLGVTANLQAALDALPASGGSLLLGPGTISVTAKVSVRSKVLIAGAGQNVSIIKQADNANLSAMLENSDTVNGNANITFRDLTIDGNKANNTGASTHGINFVSGTDYRVQNCELKENRGVGVRIESSSAAAIRRVWVESCWIHDGAPSGVASESIRIGTDAASTCEDIFVRGNRFKNNQGRQFVNVAGSLADADPIKRIHITDNSFEDTISAAIQLNLCNDTIVSNNTIYDCDSTGIAVFGDAASTTHMIRISITNNVIDFVGNVTAANGIEHSGGGRDITISGNTISRTTSTKFGISMGTCDGGAVFGNTIVNSPGGGVVLRAASSAGLKGPFNCSGNIIKDCTGAEGISASTNISGCVISNNTITNCSRGIKVADNSDGAIIDLTISGNKIFTTTLQGIWIRAKETGSTNAERVIVSNNTCRDGADSGIVIQDCNRAIVTGNLCHSNDLSGIYVTNNALSSNLIISNNMCYDNGDASVAATDDGITVSGTDYQDLLIVGNMCFDTRAGGARKQDMGINASNAAYDAILAQTNFCKNNITADVRTSASTNVLRGADTTDNNVSAVD